MLPAVSLYVGEARILAIEVFRNGSAIVPDSATIRITDTAGKNVVAETPAGISGTKAYYLIGKGNVTATPGGYTAIWTAHYGDETFICPQAIIVREP